MKRFTSHRKGQGFGEVLAEAYLFYNIYRTRYHRERENPPLLSPAQPDDMYQAQKISTRQPYPDRPGLSDWWPDLEARG